MRYHKVVAKGIAIAKISMKTDKYPFAQELITDTEGYENAYRIRVGDYRIGMIFDGEILMFQRVLHRKEIYRYFP